MDIPSPLERAAHYRRLAEDAYSRADDADDPEVINACLMVARKWLQLAERSSGPRVRRLR